MTLSARNQLKGTVKAVTLGSVMAEVVVEVAGGEIVSAITRALGRRARARGRRRGHRGHQGDRGDARQVTPVSPAVAAGAGSGPRVRSPRRLPASLDHRPLQPALRLLHAGRGRAAAHATTRSSPTRRCSPSRARRSRSAISKVRVTGGEPLVRKGCVGFIARLAALAGARRSHADDQRPAAAALRRRAARLAGLRRVNVSIDSLDAARASRGSAAAARSTRPWPASTPRSRPASRRSRSTRCCSRGSRTRSTPSWR